MIESLSGELLEKAPGHVVVECHGVGYYVHVPASAVGRLPSQGRVRLFIHYTVSVDVRSGQSEHRLHGFLNNTERALFRQLIDVQGVSGTLAMAMLSAHDADALVGAIVQGNEGALRGVKGVGPKLAQRIVAELAPRLTGGIAEVATGMPATGNTLKSEALSALLTLGLDRVKAERALQQVLRDQGSAPPALEELIRLTLKNL